MQELDVSQQNLKSPEHFQNIFIVIIAQQPTNINSFLHFHSLHLNTPVMSSLVQHNLEINILKLNPSWKISKAHIKR